MRLLLLITTVSVLMNSCADGGYRSHDYPIYIPKLTTEQSNWVRFGISDSVEFVDTAGRKLLVTALKRDTTINLDWSGMPTYETLERNGVKYNYTPEVYTTEFSIDTIEFALHIVVDSARMSYAEGFIAQLRIEYTWIDLVGSGSNYKDTLIELNGTIHPGLLYQNQSPNYSYEYREILIVPEFGFLWIRFNSGTIWKNEILLEN